MNRRMMSPTDDLILAPEISNDGAEDMYATKEANFNTNMVLILAALLCSLLFVLGLNAVARCTLRCRRRLGSDGARRTCPVGLKKNALRKIPVVVYGSGGAGICPATECPICLGEFEDGETVRVLPQCNHGFHVGCIDTWLVAHPSCPTCRHSLVDQPVMPPVIWASAGDRRV